MRAEAEPTVGMLPAQQEGLFSVRGTLAHTVGDVSCSKKVFFSLWCTRVRTYFA